MYGTTFVVPNPDTYTYQWYLDDNAISGATASSYTLSTTTKGTYRLHCVVSNSAGSVSSRIATLAVTSTPQDLFYSGDLCTDVTGGWTAKNSGAQLNVGWDDDYYGSASVSSSRLKVDTAKIADVFGGRCYTNNKVDLTNYSHIYFNYSTYGRVTFAISNSPTSDSFVKSGKVSLQYTNYWETKSGTYDLDVSSLSGSYYIVIIGGTGGTYDTMSATITKVWRE